MPIEFYELEVLKKIGLTIDPVLHVDSHTVANAKGHYARLYVQVRIDKPLITTILIGKFTQKVMYEGIQSLCFSSGRIGHKKESCYYTIKSPTTTPTTQTPTQTTLSQTILLIVALWNRNLLVIHLPRTPTLLSHLARGCWLLGKSRAEKNSLTHQVCPISCPSNLGLLLLNTAKAHLTSHLMQSRVLTPTQL